jgi:peptidoglycan L-alanyl-D-glutamate endopeptidase CwlK
MTLAQRSETKLQGVHPDLVRVIRRADEMGAKFHVTCGLRTIEEQRALLAAGKSKTLKSRHLTGHAIDVVAIDAGGVTYDHPDMLAVAQKVKAAAADCGVSVEWGGDWKSFKDTPHFQLAASQYPATAPTIEASAKSKTLADQAKPIRKSGTVWGVVAGFFAALVQFFEQSLAGAMDVVAQLSTLDPVKQGLIQTGANAKAVGLGLGVSATVVVVGRRLGSQQSAQAEIAGEGDDA